MKFFIFLLLLLPVTLFAQSSEQLTGTVIGSSTFGAGNAFDGDVNTYYKASTSSLGWVGIDLGTTADGQDRRCVITRVGWISRLGGYAELGVFEGANTSTFEDAVPLYMTTSSGSGDAWNEAEVQVTRSFRYLRYVGPHDQYCRITDLRFFGYEAEGSDSLFYQPTNLPVISIHTTSGNDPTSRRTDVPGAIGVSHREGVKHFDMECTVRYRGNGSYSLDKKGYRIKLAEKHKMAGSKAKAKKWVLIPSHGDKTLMRNLLAFDISRRMEMTYTPFCQPVDVFLNGEYKGNFELCDQLTVHKDRVNITEVEEDEEVNDETLTGGYFFEIDANFSTSGGDVGFKTAKANKSINIKSPSDAALTTQRKNWLKKYFDEMEKYLYNRNYTDQGYSRFLDFESFIRYFLINEYCSNTDTFWEMYLYKERNDSLIYSGPIWDVDLGFDNDNRTHYSLWNSTWLYANTNSSCYSDMRTVVGYIIGDSRVKQRLAEIWAYYRASGAMNTAQLEATLEEYRDLLYQSQALNFKRWKILSSYVHQNFQALGSYDKEVNYVKTFLGKRFTWLDKRANVTSSALTITIPESGWTTLYSSTAFSVPEGITAFAVYADTIADADLQRLQLDTISSTQANRPYLLHGEPGSYTLAASDGVSFRVTATDAKQLGLLTGTAYGTQAPIGSYLLQTSPDGSIGFQRQTASTTIAAQTAYLTLPVDQTSLPDFLPLGETQGIHTPHQDLAITGDVYVYSLSGELLLTLDAALLPASFLLNPAAASLPLPPGIYLVRTTAGTRKITI